MYIYGLGVAKNPATAVSWLQNAGDNGFAAAQYNLGKLYRDGADGVARSFEQAVTWFRAAAMRAPKSVLQRDTFAVRACLEIA